MKIEIKSIVHSGVRKMEVLIADKLSPKAVSQLQAIGCDETMDPDLSADDLPGVTSAVEILIVRSTKVTTLSRQCSNNPLSFSGLLSRRAINLQIICIGSDQ